MNAQILSEISLLEKTMNTSKLQLKWRLENEDIEYEKTKQDLLNAIENCFNDPYRQKLTL